MSHIVFGFVDQQTLIQDEILTDELYILNLFQLPS